MATLPPTTSSPPNLSSPFLDKLTIADRTHNSPALPSICETDIHHPYPLCEPSSRLFLPPSSPPPLPHPNFCSRAGGGRELPTARRRHHGQPGKGTLFQDTSDESFEILMTGGYGRYVRQPQPMAPTPAPSGRQTPEAPTPPRPPAENELILEAFRSNETTNTSGDAHISKLFPVNLATMGRVLIDSASDENGFAAVADSSSPSKNNAAGGKRAMTAANKAT
ncbi:hypothetical protein DFH08DRAFT_1047136 [Mycena albidolilacea]|uniref:Uncharacterized protein n=1 Tax=Mycena albidolilacea TaxID=1033008 RepID=A0AAD7AE58_9AGAR|nr:hypothetical protein DFH08DRAFT_1047136 [Mycena albidolilacea]